MAKSIGIDLGTTNSCVAVLEGGDPTVITNSEGERTTPSVVAFDRRSGERLVGQLARRQAVTNPERTVYSIKRFMGRRLQRREGRGRAGRLRGQVGPRRGHPDGGRRQGVLAAGDLRDDPAEAQEGRRGVPGRGGHRGRHHGARVLRGRPAPGDQGRRQDRRARTSSGSSTSRRRRRWPTAWTRRRTRPSSSSTSAAGRSTSPSWSSARGSSRSRPRAATTTSAATTSTPRSSSGWSRSSRRVEGIDLSKDKMAAQRLVEAAEKAKRELSSTTSTSINLPFITADQNGPKHMDLTLSRAQFNNLTADLVEATAGPVRQAMEDAGSAAGSGRPGDTRRRLDPHPGGPGAGQGDHGQGAPQGHQPGRGRRRRGRDPGRRARGRGQGRAAPRRHAALPRHRDQGRGVHQAHRAEHHHTYA